MKKLSLSFIMCSIFLSGCMADAGIKASHLLKKEQSTLTSVAYGDLDINEDVAGSYKEFLGEYSVEQSWSNNVFHINKVTIEEINDKIIISAFPEGWQIPTQRTEFTGCQVLLNDTKEREYGFNNTDKMLLCSSSTGNIFKGYSSFKIVKTNANTIGKVQISLDIGALLPNYDVKIETPYAISLDLWSRNVPVLAVKKVK